VMLVERAWALLQATAQGIPKCGTLQATQSAGSTPWPFILQRSAGKVINLSCLFVFTRVLFFVKAGVFYCVPMLVWGREGGRQGPCLH